MCNVIEAAIRKATMWITFLNVAEEKKENLFDLKKKE